MVDIQQMDIIAAAFLVAAPIFLFYGEKFLKLVVFGSGFAAGYIGASYLLNHVANTLSNAAHIGIIVAAGIVAGLLLLCLEKLGVFIIGAIPGILFGNVCFQMIASNYPDYNSDGVHIGVLVVMPLLGGVLAIYLMSSIMKLLTAFAGGYFAVSGFDHFAFRFGWKNSNPLDPESFFKHAQDFQCTDNWCYSLLGAWLALFIVGVMTQFHCTAKPAQEDAAEPLILNSKNTGNPFNAHVTQSQNDLRQPFITYR